MLKLVHQSIRAADGEMNDTRDGRAGRPGALIDRIDTLIAKRLARREQTAHFAFAADRTVLSTAHMPYADLIAAAIVEVADLSTRRTVIEIRVSGTSITISGSNPVSFPDIALRPDAVVLDHAEAAGLPVHLAWEQCIGPQLTISLRPGGFTVSRGYGLAGEAAQATRR